MARETESALTKRVAGAIAAKAAAILREPSNTDLRRALESETLTPAAFQAEVTASVFEDLVRALARARGLDENAFARGTPARWHRPREGDDTENLASELDPDRLGSMYEWTLGLAATIGESAASLELSEAKQSRRKRTGSYYTPSTVVEMLLDLTLEPVIEERTRGIVDPHERDAALLGIRVCDPAAGCGRFLLGAARRLAGHLDRPDAIQDVARRCIHGMDLDPTAAWLCRATLMLECPVADASIAGNIRTGDALRDEWNTLPGEGTAPGAFDVVIGNPPFLNQLRSDSALDRSTVEQLKSRFDGAITAYTDTAAIFMLLAESLLDDGGRLCLVQPQSFLTARDARPVRDRMLERCSLRALWVTDEPVFAGTSVLTCAPVLQRATSITGTVSRRAGTECRTIECLEVDPIDLIRAPTWSHLAAGCRGIPEIEIGAEGVLGDIAQATADFRDQYYGLEGFIVEDSEVPGAPEAEYPALVTTRLVEPCRCLWGETPTRVLKTGWNAPRIDRRAMTDRGDLGPWMAERLVPKILVATQTRVLEAFVDEHGRYLPSTPVITVTGNDSVSDLWRIASVLLSPVATALAMQRYAGAALSSDAIKLSAKQVLALPLPSRSRAWSEASDHIRIAHGAVSGDARHSAIMNAGAAMCTAFELSGDDRADVLRWWAERLEKRPRRASDQVALAA